MNCLELEGTNGKARIVTNGTKVYLKSYDTTVASWDRETREFARHWGKYSATTARHVNQFRALYGLPALRKRAWLELPVQEV